jgi:hypothetical protein
VTYTATELDCLGTDKAVQPLCQERHDPSIHSVHEDNIALGFSMVLGCGSLVADTVYYRCVEQSNPEAILLVTIDPLLGEIKAKRYSGNTLWSRTTYQIDVLDVTTIRGQYVLPILGIAIVLELDRAKGRVTETIGGKLPIYYNCEPPSATL